MKKKYGISDSDLEEVLDQYVLNQGGTIDVYRLRDGLGELIRKNNEALLEDIKEMINQTTN